MALSVKIPIIDAILAPFGYKLRPVTRRSISESFRSLSGELSMNDESMNILADFAERAIDAVSSKSYLNLFIYVLLYRMPSRFDQF